jgi:IS30 family transposase
MEKNLQCIKKSRQKKLTSILQIHSPERGANENLNGLYKAIYTQIDLFEEITIERIIEIQEKLNNRPRKRFNFENTKLYMFNRKKVAFVT